MRVAHPNFRDRLDVVADVLEILARTFAQPTVELSRLLLSPVFRELHQLHRTADYGAELKRLGAIDARPRSSDPPGEDGYVLIAHVDVSVVVESILVCFRREIEDAVAQYNLPHVDLSMPCISLAWIRALLNTLRRIVAQRRVRATPPVTVEQSPTAAVKRKRARTPPTVVAKRLADAIEALGRERGLHAFTAKDIEGRSGIPESTAKGHALWATLMARRAAATRQHDGIGDD